MVIKKVVCFAISVFATDLSDTGILLAQTANLI